MGKITKRQTKLHDEALARLNKDMTEDDIEFVFHNYNPMAEHNIGKGAIFFTPYGLAGELAVMCQPKGSVIDLCAGIGVLSHKVLLHDQWGGDIKRMVCIENNPAFVEIGKKLVPEAEWYCGSVFDLELLNSLGEFDCAISNPPYGNISSKQRAKWPKVKGPAQWLVIEVALRMAYNGGMFILPRGDSDYDFDPKPLNYANPATSWTRNHYTEDAKSQRLKYLERHFPGVIMFPASIDTSLYKDKWVGASPDVLIVDVNLDGVGWERPFGFSDVIEQPKPQLAMEI